MYQEDEFKRLRQDEEEHERNELLPPVSEPLPSSSWLFGNIEPNEVESMVRCGRCSQMIQPGQPKEWTTPLLLSTASLPQHAILADCVAALAEHVVQLENRLRSLVQGMD